MVTSQPTLLALITTYPIVGESIYIIQAEGQLRTRRAPVVHAHSHSLPRPPQLHPGLHCWSGSPM